MKKIYLLSFLLVLVLSAQAQWQARLTWDGSFNQMAQNTSNGSVYLGRDNIIYESTDHGVTWNQIGVLPTANPAYAIMTMAVNSVTNQVLVGVNSRNGSFTGIVWIGQKNGNTWEWNKLNTGLPGAVAATDHVQGLLSSAGSFKGKFFIGMEESDGVYMLENGATQWTRITELPARTYVNTFVVQNNTAYLALDNKSDASSPNGGIWKSTDGITWQRSGLNNHTIWWLAVTNTPTGMKFLANNKTEAGIFESVDGQNWRRLNWYFSDYELRFALDSEGVIYAAYGEDSGTGARKFVKSNDNGETWIDIRDNLPGSALGVNAIAMINNQLTIVTGGGVYQRSVISGAKEEEVAKLRIKVFPNPSNGTIQVTPPAQGNYQLAVFDTQGKKQVEYLACSGTKQISTAAFKAGLYLVQITRGETVWTERLVVK